MSSAEYKTAYTQGVAACRAGQHTTENPYAPRRVHFLADPPGPKQSALAGMWLRGWQSAARARKPAPQRLT